VTGEPASSVTGQAAAAISTAGMRILREYTGRGPTQAKTTISRDHVIVVLGGALTTAERNLVTHGMDDQVRQIRGKLQTAMRDDLIEAVEQALGRRVLAVLSDTEVHADLAVEVFTLAPPETVTGPSVTSSDGRFSHRPW
jgi:uncharacterized protein YbcI